MNLSEAIIKNYMPYAKGMIVGRAIPYIDGFKPAGRRIIYTMYRMGLLTGDKAKSTKCVGQTMTYHPHGDSSIYETLVRMTAGNEALNVPYIDNKGNFGKSWSKDTSYAAARYTEAKLAPISAELVEGLNEDAVNMVYNFDNSELEPELLPVKFPNILVNTSGGIAVGYSSNISPFGLKEVCEATIGILEGKVNSVEDLMEVIGMPEFITGGYIHKNQRELYKICSTGRASFVVSGKVEIHGDTITVKEIPFRATVESIVEEIRGYMKTELKEVSSVKDLSDLGGLNIQIVVKRGANPRKVLKKLTRFTRLRMQMGFINEVIIDGRRKTLGVYPLLQEWIKFRLETVGRIYSYRLAKKQEQVHLLETWTKIKEEDIDRVIQIISKNKENDAREILMNEYGMDEDQAEFLMEIKLRSITSDGRIRELENLKKNTATMHEYAEIVGSEQRKKDIIVSELRQIVKKYGKDRRTIIVDELEEEPKEEEKVVSDHSVTVVVTKKGFVKKLVTLKDLSNFQTTESDPEKFRVTCRNNEDLLVFTYSGACYKIPVDDIDSSRGIPKEYLYSLVERFDESEILTVMASGDYSGSFNVVYESGRGAKVYLDKLSGNRKRYKSQFLPGVPGEMWATTEDEFFVITYNRNAAYVDLTMMMALSKRKAFKACRVSSKDSIFGIQPASKVPDIESIDLERYSKGYCVKIRDVLWKKREPEKVETEAVEEE